MSKLGSLPSEWSSSITLLVGCWLWTSPTIGQGYASTRGVAQLEPLSPYAHRAVWLHCGGTIPPGVRIAQSCGNRRCVHPAHLIALVTPRTLATLSRGVWRGERNPKAKLTAPDVLRIRHQLRSGVTKAEVAAIWQIGLSTVSAIDLRRRWRHLP